MMFRKSHMTQLCLMKYEGKIAGRASRKRFLAFKKCPKENIDIYFYHTVTSDIEI